MLVSAATSLVSGYPRVGALEPEAESELVLWDLTPDGVLTLTWNRPERKNAWTPDLEFAYFAALDRAQANADVRAVVVTGSGGAFCPGLDMQRLAKISGEGKLSIADRRPQYTPRLFTKPLLAAINGPCAGIGLVQALMADLRFAGTGARFSTAFTRRGPRSRIRDGLGAAQSHRRRQRDGPAAVGPHVRSRGGEGARARQPAAGAR